ncbi:flagellar biosynthesis protein FlhF [Spongiibacter taiwanensis]|uniref:flagellar biosynthesis protein FlhF n=1 Tax=Spongiibacter taiwanensis TaxID=1748242 RepID=UPI002034BD6B|nr:flagellar biosynthesis protein FlhF [Spongiibacter taiwanensis]USA43810.1 flagellar biosynthesis protein FlhF [Spongiibacter taiwanensis]
MKIKKYRAADTRQAMKLVKAAHGPDAVVLDCYSVDDGVELVVSWEDTSHAPNTELSAVDLLRAREQAAAETQQPVQQAAQNTNQAQPTPAAAQPRMVWSQDDELLTMKRELAEMKTMLMGQLKGHSWKEADYSAPEHTDLHTFMAALDLDPELGSQLAEQIPADEAPSIRREILKMVLARSLPVIAPPSVGAIALVGPQGSGKTTSIAKLAAQHVLQHGKDSVAILSTDTARVGAQEQLRAYGSILQVPVHCADTVEEAGKIYRLLRKKSLLLVDTGGVSFRDKAGIDGLAKLLAALPEVNVMLNLPADSQAHVQREILDAYRVLAPQAVLVSRIDEATRLGGVISNLIQCQLPMTWVSNGPNVPRNLSVADAGKLVKMAVKMASFYERASKPTAQAAPRQAEAAGAASAPGQATQQHAQQQAGQIPGQQIPGQQPGQASMPPRQQVTGGQAISVHG